MIYLDNAATTPVRREAIEAMWPHLTGAFGNPSSHHRIGEAAARALADARSAVAGVLGARPGEIVFTSGGTEADNLAVKGIALAEPRGRHIVTTPLEHEAVLESVDFLRRAHGFEVTMLRPDATGLVDPAGLAAALRPDTTLVSVQYANNEIGTVQPIAELAAVARAAGVPFHTDAVQAAGWLPLDVTLLGVDAMSLSGHKVGAPAGIGALFVRSRLRLEPVLHGGGQERDRRSGTENVAGAVALATALRLADGERRAETESATDRGRALVTEVAHDAGVAHDAEVAEVADDAAVAAVAAVTAVTMAADDAAAARVARVSDASAMAGETARRRDAFIDAVLGSVPTAILTGHPALRLPGTASFVFPGTSGEAVLLELEQHGIVCSSGSACAAGSDEPSHVLTAIGLPAAVAQTAVRFTLSRGTTAAELAEAAEAVAASVAAVAGLGRSSAS